MGWESERISAMSAKLQSFNALVTSTPGRISLRVGTFAIEVALERRHIARGSSRQVRHVDARTGADPSLRQTIVLLGARHAIPWLIGTAIPGQSVRQREQQLEFQREVQRAHAEHAGDPEARQEAISRIYQTREPVHRGCLTVLLRALVPVAVNRCAVPFISQRWTLADLLAGTRMVRDGPRRSSRLCLRAFRNTA